MDSLIDIDVWHQATESEIDIEFTTSGIAARSRSELGSGGFSSTPTSPVAVHITEYGAVGQHVAGNFSGTFTDGTHTHTISGNFRIKRAPYQSYY